MSDEEKIIQLVPKSQNERTPAIEWLEEALREARGNSELKEAIIILFNDKGDDGIQMKRFSTDSSLITARIVLECETNKIQSMMYEKDDE